MGGQERTLDEILVLECLENCGYPLDGSTMVFHLSGKTDTVDYWRDFSMLLDKMQKGGLIETSERQVCNPYSHSCYTLTTKGLAELNRYREKQKANS